MFEADIQVTGAGEIALDCQAWPARASNAMVRALRRALTAGRAEMARSIAGDTGLKVRDVKTLLRTKVTASKQGEDGEVTATLSASLARIPLVKFAPQGPEPSRGKGQGISYRVGATRSRKEHAFFATVRAAAAADSHRGIFMRKADLQRKSPRGWSLNLPIKQLYGPSIGHVFAKYRPQATARMAEALRAETVRQLAFAERQRGVQVEMTEIGEDDGGTD